MQQVWVYIAVSIASYDAGRVEDYKEFNSYLECAQYEEQQVFKANMAAGCMPAMKKEER